MPAIDENTLSSSEELDDDNQISSNGTWKRRDSNTSTKIDRVVLENRERFQPSAYAESYEDQEEDEEWTVLSPRDHRDESKAHVDQKRSLFSSVRRHIGFLMCFLVLLTFVMAMLICTVWAVPGVFTETLVIAPNDTVLAAYQVDTLSTLDIRYTLSSVPGGDVNSSDSLVIFNGTCDALTPSSAEVHVNDSVSPSDDSDRTVIGHLYLVPESKLDYTVTLTLSSATNKVPADCFASLHIFKDYFSFRSFLDSNDTSRVVSSYAFCNTLTVRFTLAVKDTPSYYFFALYAANRGQVKSVNVQANGTMSYYDSTSPLFNKACQITPSVNSTCTVPIGHQTESDVRVCLLITRGTPYLLRGTDHDTKITATMSNGDLAGDSGNSDNIIQAERKLTTYWGVNRTAVFVCLFVPLLISCCVLTILTPRRANYGSYIRVNRKKPLN